MATISLQLLSHEERERVHQAALTLLWKTGMRVLDAEARSILGDAGAEVDEADRRVRFPSRMVEEAIQGSPAEIRLYGRDVERQIAHLRPHAVYYTTNGYATQVYDHESKTRRDIDQASLSWLTRLADGLDQIDIYAVLGTPCDAPARTNDRYQMAISLINTTKHIWNTAYGKDGVEDAVRMATAVRGSRQALRDYPLFTLDLTVVSPLELDERQGSTMIAGAREGIPIGISPGPIAGATGPVTLAGTLTQATAEVLGAAALVQAVRPGTPVIFTQYTRALDMASGNVSMGGPEFSLFRIATAEMARYYDIPSRGGAMITDAKAPDAQMGAEKMMGCLMASLGGLNVVAGIGQADFINTVRPDLMVMDNEMVRVVRHLMRGFDIDNESLALELIDAVGPGGNYLAADHTLRHFRSELLTTRLWDRKAWADWEGAGARDISERAWQAAQHTDHIVPALGEGIEEAIWDIVREADARA